MSAVAALIVFAGWFVLPAIAIASLLARPQGDVERDQERFLVVALVAGFSTWTLLAHLLASRGWLNAASSWIGALVLAVASLVVIAGRGRPTLAVLWRGPVREYVPYLGLGLLTLPVIRLLLVNLDTFANPTPWYYSDLVRQTVAAQGSPTTSVEWGRLVPFLDDYPGFTAGTGLITASGSHASLAAEHLVTLVVLCTTVLAMYLLCRAFDASRLGSFAGAALLLASSVFGFKLLSFRPEAAGYTLALLLPALAIDWMRTRHVGRLLLAATGFAALGQIHGIDWTLSGMLVVAALAVSVLGSRERGRDLRAAGVAVAALGAVWAAFSILATQSLSGLQKVQTLPRVVDGVDPTWEFFRLVTLLPAESGPPSGARLIESSMKGGLAELGWAWSVALAIGAVVLLLIGARPSVGPRRWRALRILVFAIMAFVVIVVASTYLDLKWDTYVPRRTGYGRLLQLWPLLLAVIAAGAVTVLEELFGRFRGFVTGLVILAVALLAVHTYPSLEDVSTRHPPDDQSAALRAFELPDDALVLSNAYTESYPTVEAGIRSVLDGRAPYLEAPLLGRANRMLRDAQRYFGSEHGPLPCRGITHVLVALDGDWRLATPNVFGTDVAALDADQNLEYVSEASGLRLYRVLPGAPTTDLECRNGRPR